MASSDDESLIEENIFPDKVCLSMRQDEPLSSECVQNEQHPTENCLNTNGKERPNKCYTDELEAALEQLLLSDDLTKLHSQYFCVRGDYFVCQVCSEEIECTNHVSSLKNHCTSYKHNNILKQTATSFFSTRGNTFQLPLTTAREHNFKRAIIQLENQYPFSKSKHCLRYISFNSLTFFCIICNNRLPSEKPFVSVPRHISTCKIHKLKSLELALEYVSKIKDSSLENKTVSLTNVEKGRGSGCIEIGKNENTLKAVLKADVVTMLHAQCFRIVDNNFYCHVCLSEVKFNNNVRSLTSHCASSNHDNALKQIVTAFVSDKSKYFLKSQSETNQDKFRQVINELKMQTLFFQFSYFLDLFAPFYVKIVCLICGRTLPYSKTCVQNHILNSKNHNQCFLDLVIAYSEQKANAKKTLPSKTFDEKVVQIKTNTEPTRNSSCSENTQILSPSVDLEILKAIDESTKLTQKYQMVPEENIKESLECETSQLSTNDFSFESANELHNSDSDVVSYQTEDDDMLGLSENSSCKLKNYQEDSTILRENNLPLSCKVEKAKPWKQEIQETHLKINYLHYRQETSSKTDIHGSVSQWKTLSTNETSALSSPHHHVQDPKQPHGPGPNPYLQESASFIPEQDDLFKSMEAKLENLEAKVENLGRFFKSTNFTLKNDVNEETNAVKTAPEQKNVCKSNKIKKANQIMKNKLSHLLKSVTDVNVKRNKKYIRLKGEELYCTLCSVPCGFSINSKSHPNSMQVHFNGKQHTANANHDQKP